MMRRLFGFLAVAICLTAAVNDSLAATTKITASVSITNAPTTNGQTITVNGNVRTWTNTVFLTASQILTNSTAAGSKTNLYNAVGLAPFTSVVVVDKGSTNLDLVANSGVNLTVTLSAGWGTVAYSTQTVSQMWDVRVPISGEASGGQRTNIASLVVKGINDQSTNTFYEDAIAVSRLVGITNAQTITGNKYLTGSSNYLGAAYLSGPTSTNGVNYGNAFSSPGSGLGSEQFGSGASASASSTVAVGPDSVASALGAVALGKEASASGQLSIAIGDGAQARDTSAVALGGVAAKPGSSALGQNTFANHTNSSAIGANATTTADNQVMLGAAGISVVVNNGLGVLGGATFANGVTNLLFTGTNTFPAGAGIAFGRKSLSSLANGNNAAVAVGTNAVIDVSGPSGAFTINGCVPVVSGQMVWIVNLTGQNMTIAYDSGVDPTAANRIYTLTGADVSTTGNGAACLWYNANVSRWIALWVTP